MEWIKDLIAQAARHEKHLAPGQVQLEADELEAIARRYLNGFEQGIWTIEEICRDVEKYAVSAKEHVLNANPDANYFGGRNGLFSVKCHAIVLPKLADYFRSLAPQAQKPEPEEGPRKPGTSALALYYYFLHLAGFYTELSSQSGRKKKTLEELADKHGISAQNLYQTFNAINQRVNQKNPLRNPEHLESAIELLADFPDAQDIAKSKLKEIEK